MKQTTFAGAKYAGKRKQTRKERFLIEMDQVDRIPDETTILNLRRLMEKRRVGGRNFAGHQRLSG